MQAATSRLKVHGRDDFPEHFKLPMIGNASGGAILDWVNIQHSVNIQYRYMNMTVLEN